MNAKKAKALRRIAERITTGRNLPARAASSMTVGPADPQLRFFNATNTTPGQYRTLKGAIADAYGSKA